jgi:hypothetical protein
MSKTLYIPLTLCVAVLCILLYLFSFEKDFNSRQALNSDKYLLNKNEQESSSRRLSVDIDAQRVRGGLIEVNRRQVVNGPDSSQSGGRAVNPSGGGRSSAAGEDRDEGSRGGYDGAGRGVSFIGAGRASFIGAGRASGGRPSGRSSSSVSRGPGSGRSRGSTSASSSDGRGDRDDHRSGGQGRISHRSRANPEKPLVLNPRNFSLEGLSAVNRKIEFPAFSDSTSSTRDYATAADHLCAAAFQRDIPNLKRLLYDMGVSSQVSADLDGQMNALHCLASSYINTEKTSLLANTVHKETWLHDRLDREYFKHGQIKTYSILMRELFEDEYPNVVATAQWLLRAGVPINDKDRNGNTPLIIASIGGLDSLVKYLLQNGADVNLNNKDGRNAMHFATVFGHYQVAEVNLCCVSPSHHS